MKKISKLLLSLTLILSLFLISCSSETKPNTTTTVQSEQSTNNAIQEQTNQQDNSSQNSNTANTSNSSTNTSNQTSSSSNTQTVSPISLTKGTVTRVVDGDTAEININGKIYKVRFIGVNTPESTTRIEPYGKEASNYTKSQLTGKTVYLEKDVSETDKYGRLLRYIWLQPPTQISDNEIRSKMFNAILVLNGYAQAATYPPDVKYADYFVKYTSETRNKNIGLWALNSSSSGSTNNSSSGTTTQKPSTSTSNNRTVYFTPSGKSYHYDRNCKTLARSKTILEGTLQEAINSGHSDPCDVCVH